MAPSTRSSRSTIKASSSRREPAERSGLSPQPSRRRGTHPRQGRDAYARSPRPRSPSRASPCSTTPTPCPDVGFPCVVKPAGLSASRGVIRADDRRRRAATPRGGPPTSPAAARSSSRSTCRAGGRGRRTAPRRCARGPRRVRQAGRARRPVLRGDDLRHAVAPRPGRRSPRSNGSPPTPRRRSVSSKGRSTPSCASTVTGVRSSRSRRDRSAGCVRARCGSAPASASRRSSSATRSGVPLDGLARETAAAGRDDAADPAAGTLVEVHGQDAARAVPGDRRSRDHDPSWAPGPSRCPKGDRYLGFLFARGDDARRGRIARCGTRTHARGGNRDRLPTRSLTRCACCWSPATSSAISRCTSPRPPLSSARRARGAVPRPLARTVGCRRRSPGGPIASRSPCRCTLRRASPGGRSPASPAPARAPRRLLRPVRRPVPTAPTEWLPASVERARRLGRRVATTARSYTSAATPARRAPLPARDLLPPLDQYAHLLVGGEDGSSATSRPATAARIGAGTARCPWSTTGASASSTSTRSLADVEQQVARGRPAPDLRRPRLPQRRAPLDARRRCRTPPSSPSSPSTARSRSSTSCADATLWPELRGRWLPVRRLSVRDASTTTTLARLDKGHTPPTTWHARSRCCASTGIEIRPSWMPFTPWTTLEDVRGILDFVADTTSSATSTRCSTRSGCCSHRDRCSSTTRTSPRTSGATTPNGRRTRGRRRIRRWTSSRHGSPRSSRPASSPTSRSRCSTPRCEACGLDRSGSIPHRERPTVVPPSLTELVVLLRAEPTRTRPSSRRPLAGLSPRRSASPTTFQPSASVPVIVKYTAPPS